MSKTRSRRTGCLSILGIITLAAGLFIAREVYLAVTATPGDAVDYHRELIRLSEESQPPGEDGWPFLVEAIARQERVEGEFERGLPGLALKAIRDPGEISWEVSEYTPQQYRAAAERLIERLREDDVWSLLDQLASSPRAVRDTTDQDVEVLLHLLLHHTGKTRQLGYAAIVRMRLAHERADDAEAAGAFEHALALARVSASQPLIIDHVVGLSISAGACRELQHELLERAHDTHALRTMLAACDQQAMPSIALALQGERIVTMDVVQWTHTDDGNGNGRLILSQVEKIRSGGPVPSIANIQAILYPSKQETVELADRLYSTTIERASLSYQERRKEPDDLYDLPPRQVVLEIVFPAFGRAMQEQDQWRTLIGGAKLALAVELYNAETGAYPDSLPDLVPDFLEALPTDPYALDGAFRYKRFETPDEHRRRYLLYSTSIDGRDDGGNFDPDEPMVPGAQKDGFDVILNMPREEPPPTP
jgi:hypothetical protein